MGIAIRQGDGLMSATVAEFENEAELEQVLTDQVDLLRSPQEPRLAVVARQVNLSDAGILDMLCVDEAGLPVAVEVKLSRNGQSRREIVAQIVDYLSSLTSLTVDEVDSEVDGALEQSLISRKIKTHF